MTPIETLIAAALFLAVVNERLIAYLAQPIKDNLPGVRPHLWLLTYVALATGILLGLASGVNLFAGYIQDLRVGVLLTGIVIGGGSNLLHDLWPRPPKVSVGPSAGWIPAAKKE